MKELISKLFCIHEYETVSRVMLGYANVREKRKCTKCGKIKNIIY